MARGGARLGAGRKKGKVSAAKLALAEMAKEHADAALRTLVDIATGAGSESARVSAATAILDRAYGKPSPAVDLADSSVGQHIIVSWKGKPLPGGPNRIAHSEAMRPVLKNAKHELFAQALAKGMPAIRAYEAAGYKPDRGATCRLSANVSVRARLNELLEKAAERTLVTVERVTAELEEVRQLALANKRLSVGVSATMNRPSCTG